MKTVPQKGGGRRREGGKEEEEEGRKLWSRCMREEQLFLKSFLKSIRG